MYSCLSSCLMHRALKTHPQVFPALAYRPAPCFTDKHTSRLIGDFVQILGSKFWALGGLNQKLKNNVLYRESWRTDGQIMARFHRETKTKNRFEGTSRVIGDFIPNFVAMATRVGPTTFSMVPLNRRSPKTP